LAGVRHGYFSFGGTRVDVEHGDAQNFASLHLVQKTRLALGYCLRTVNDDDAQENYY
jgi:hypothetical protein